MSIIGDTSDVKNYANVTNALSIKTSTGDMSLSSITCANELKIRVTTGDAHVSDTTCKTLVSSGSTGDLTLRKVIVTERLSAERGTGDVKFDSCDAAEIFVTTDTGDVTGTLLTEKVFIPRSDTGEIDVPKTITGGRCEITTDTGDIKIRIAQ